MCNKITIIKICLNIKKTRKPGNKKIESHQININNWTDQNNLENIDSILFTLEIHFQNKQGFSKLDLVRFHFDSSETLLYNVASRATENFENFGCNSDYVPM